MLICFQFRDVAQLGSAHVWGAWGRRFKSSHPDHFFLQIFTLNYSLSPSINSQFLRQTSYDSYFYISFPIILVLGEISSGFLLISILFQILSIFIDNSYLLNFKFYCDTLFDYLTIFILFNIIFK